MPRQSSNIPRVDVYSRHRPECKSKAEGFKYVRCDCPKTLVWYQGGKRQWESAGTNDYQIAQRKAAEKMAAFLAAADSKPESITVTAAVDLFIDRKRASGYKAQTVMTLEHIFKDGLETFCIQRGIMHLRDIKAVDLEAWRATWTGAAITRSKVQSRVKGFFEWAVNSDMLDKSPARGLERIKANDMAPTMPLTDAQFKTVLDVASTIAEARTLPRERLVALLLLQRWSGLARRDACMVERASFKKLDSGWYRLFLRRAKTGSDVFVSLAPGIGDKILAIDAASPRYLFWDGVGNVQQLCDNVGRAYQRISVKAKLTDEHGQSMDFHSHMLRDTFAVWCFLQGMATEDVAALLGHKNIRVTQQHYSPWIGLRQERLAGIVEAAYQQWESVSDSPCQSHKEV